MADRMDKIYQDLILKHNQEPCNHQIPDQYDVKLSLNNPRCGDWVEIFLSGSKSNLEKHFFWNKSCILLKSSASILMEMLRDNDVIHFKQWKQQLEKLLENKVLDDATMPSKLLPFKFFAGHSARKQCVLLPWRAFEQALEQLPLIPLKKRR